MALIDITMRKPLYIQLDVVNWYEAGSEPGFFGLDDDGNTVR